MLCVDKNAKRGKNTAIIYTDKSFYGQVQYFVAIEPVSDETEPNFGSFLFAVILPCQLLDDTDTNKLRLPCYRQHTALEVVDINTIEGLVGRVHDRHRNFWALVEREGEFCRLDFSVDQEDP